MQYMNKDLGEDNLEHRHEKLGLQLPEFCFQRKYASTSFRTTFQPDTRSVDKM